MDMIIPVCTINHIRDEYTTHTLSLSFSVSPANSLEYYSILRSQFINHLLDFIGYLRVLHGAVVDVLRGHG